MSVRGWRFATLLFAALSLTMESAHLLELPQKLQYDAAMYAAVNTTLYRGFAIVGGIYQVGSIILAIVLTALVRRRGETFGWTLAGAILLTAAFGVWLAIVQPVNLQVADAIVSDPASVPAVWMRMRLRWEGGHAAGFVLQVVGFSCLLGSVLVETPPDGEARATHGAAW
jgi:hypothetical protein